MYVRVCVRACVRVSASLVRIGRLNWAEAKDAAFIFRAVERDHAGIVHVLAEVLSTTLAMPFLSLSPCLFSFCLALSFFRS